MSSRVFVTGIGIISAIGKNVEETLVSIMNGRPGIGKLDNFSTRHRDQLAVGEVKIPDDTLKLLCDVDIQEKISRTSLLGMLAAREALNQAAITDINEFKTGIISATSVGGMAQAENHFMEFLDPDDNNEYIEYVNTLDCSDSTEQIADFLGITDFVSTISTACSSSANSIMFGARLIKQGLVDRIIVGGTGSL